MSRRDDFHFPVRRALEKEGWTITNDPLVLYFKDVRLRADLGAKHLAADKEGRKIAVEVKDFDSGSQANELERMIGQLELYQWALDEQEPDRELFLAVSREVYDERVLNAQSALHAVVTRKRIKLIVFDSSQEVILQWVRQVTMPTS
jgi:hypothetical protein